MTTDFRKERSDERVRPCVSRRHNLQRYHRQRWQRQQKESDGNLYLILVRAYYGSVDVNLFFGKTDMVVTAPEYRHRGLVKRLLFEMGQPQSEAQEDVLQFLAGKRKFYR